MKKTQVALAALALVASTATMAEVKISGVLDFGVGHTTNHGSYMEQGAFSDHSSLIVASGAAIGCNSP